MFCSKKLATAYHLPETTVINIPQKINNNSVSWTVGAALYEVYYLECEICLQFTWTGYLTAVIVVASLLALTILTILVIFAFYGVCWCIRRRGQYTEIIEHKA